MVDERLYQLRPKQRVDGLVFWMPDPDRRMSYRRRIHWVVGDHAYRCALDLLTRADHPPRPVESAYRPSL